MCLGIPGKVIKTYREHDVLMGKVSFGGISRNVCLEYVPDVLPDDYVLVHVGFALSRIDEEEARRVFEVLNEMDQLRELGDGEPARDNPPATVADPVVEGDESAGENGASSAPPSSRGPSAT